jgi:hypothetical protein
MHERKSDRIGLNQKILYGKKLSLTNGAFFSMRASINSSTYSEAGG